MPRLALTTNGAVNKIPLSAKGQVTYYCTELTGFCVRAGTQTKTFYLWKRVHGRHLRVPSDDADGRHQPGRPQTR